MGHLSDVIVTRTFEFQNGHLTSDCLATALKINNPVRRRCGDALRSMCAGVRAECRRCRARVRSVSSRRMARAFSGRCRSASRRGTRCCPRRVTRYMCVFITTAPHNYRYRNPCRPPKTLRARGRPRSSSHCTTPGRRGSTPKRSVTPPVRPPYRPDRNSPS